MKVLDLFSGIGGFSLGLERAGMETVAFCEIDPFCQKVLKKHWPQVPIYEDVRNLNYDGSVDLICGGYPCQPFSTAGKRKGADDDRHLWPAMFSLIKKYRPAWVVGENVAGHVSMGLDGVLSDLEGEGYACQPFIVPACAVGAPHRRDRVWIVAHVPRGDDRGRSKKLCETDGRQGRALCAEAGCSSENVANGQQPGLEGHAGYGARGCQSGWEQEKANGPTGPRGLRGTLAHTENDRREWQRDAGQGTPDQSSGCLDGFKAEWLPEPDVGRVAHGVPDRVDRLRALGNAVVPKIPEIIGRAIMAVEGVS